MNLPPFDFLIAVLFNDGFPKVHAGYLIPLAVVRQFARKKGNRDVLLARERFSPLPE